MSESSRTIFYLLNYGSSVRNMVKGGVISHLIARGYTFVFLCVNPRDRVEMEKSLPAGSFTFEELGPVDYSGFPRMLQRLRTYVWRGRINYRELRDIQKARWTWVITLQLWFGYLLRLVPFGVWEALALMGTRWERGPELFEKYHPCAVMASNPVHDDCVALEYARKRGVYTAVAVESWDNLTNRGALYAFPSDLFVWNTLVRKQALDLHRYPPDRVHATGIQSFDLYAHPERYPTEAEWRRMNGLPDSGPVICYSLASCRVSQAQDYVVRDLLALKASGVLPADATILVRFHPRDFDQVVAQYAGLEGIVPQVPDRDKIHADNDSTLGGSPLMLGATMRYSSVVINIFSTTCLDALCNDTPVVVVFYDPPNQAELGGEKTTIKRMGRYPHIRELLSFDAVFVANSPGELGRHVAACLADKHIHREQRRRLVDAETFGLDGKASERTAEILLRRIQSYGGLS